MLADRLMILEYWARWKHQLILMSLFEELSLAAVIGKNDKSLFAKIVSHFSLKNLLKSSVGPNMILS